MANNHQRFSPLGTPVVNAEGQLMWELETPVFRCRMPASRDMQEVISLDEAVQDPRAQPFFEILIPRPPFALLEATVELFRGMVFLAGKSTEALVQLTYAEGQWGIRLPRQAATEKEVVSGTVRAADRVAIEVHSHGRSPAYFSPTDDADETDGFVYCVIGDVMAWSPSACFRVGHAGCFLDLEIGQVFTLPEGLILPERPPQERSNE